jgi:hypothetical protein
MVRSFGFALVAFAAPVLGVVLGLPLALPPLGDGPILWAALPVYAAVLAAPGYLSCAYGAAGARASSARRRWWIRGSMLVAAAASIAALWGATLMFLFGPPGLVSLGCVGVLWTRFERA